MRVTPAPHPEQADINIYYPSTEARREAEALRQISVVQETSQRFQVIRLTAAPRNWCPAASLCRPPRKPN